MSGYQFSNVLCVGPEDGPDHDDYDEDSSP